MRLATIEQLDGDMIRGTGFKPTTVLTGVVLSCALLLATPLSAFGQAPHVATTTMTDTCAMCHRAHTGAGDFGRVDAESWEMTGSALGITVPTDPSTWDYSGTEVSGTVPAGLGDTPLCYVCHGIDALGSGAPVGASFAETSTHSLAPQASPFGPSVKYCSSCHDAHGTAKTAGGTPYAALLRARNEDGSEVYAGSAYCGTCHQVREEGRFDGVAVYEQTAHYTALPDPANGTDVRCTTCHQSHGSAIAPLIASRLLPPSIADTFTVTANDRTLCLACHDEARGTYSGETSYALSAHAASSVTTTIPGEWPAEDAERRVGECQVCHAPMGRDDGTGAPIASLLEIEGSALCLSCHDVDGPASTDLASLQYPAASVTDLELIAGFSPETTTSAFGAVAVWSTEATETTPRSIIGPRMYVPSGTSGAVAVGDLDGDGLNDVVVVDPGTHRLTVYIADPLKGLTSYYGPGAVDLSAVDPLLTGVTPDFVLIADVFADPTLNAEIIIGDADTGDIYVLRWLEPPYVPTPRFTLAYGELGAAVSLSGMTAGNLTGDGRAEIVITDDDALAPAVRAFAESVTTPETLEPLFSAAALSGVRGPSIGDVHPAAGVEVAVANSLEPATTAVSLYAADGSWIADYAIDAVSGEAWQTLIADVWSGVPGAELVVAIDAWTAASSINVFPQGVADLGAPVSYLTGVGYRTGSLAAGDIDGDGAAELAVGNGGIWSRLAAEATAPSVQVFFQNATNNGFDTGLTRTLRAGGVERAGTAPWLAVADLGGLGPSRHPVGAVTDAHVSTETVLALRHVECADCHNAHEATSTVAAAPAAYGLIRGTFGATAAHTPAEPITAEYELCYKCHSAYQTADALEGARDISADFAVGNASVHAVEQSVATTVNAQTFVTGWGNSSVLYCIDCHSVAGDTPAVAGPHTSAEAPILKLPYLGVAPGDEDLLCYGCHKRTVYFTGSEDTTVTTGSFFWDADAGALHTLHVNTHGFGCASCHVSHGSPTNERLIRDAIAYDADARTCTGPCHPAPGITYTP